MTNAGNDDVSPQQTLLTENRDDLRVSGDFDGNRSFRRLTAGEPGGVAESESCLDYQMKKRCKLLSTVIKWANQISVAVKYVNQISIDM